MNLPKETAHVREIFRNYRKSAKRRGIYFGITVKEFLHLASQNCTYCGAEPSIQTWTLSKNKIPLNGVDRIDSDLGYKLGNCVPACKDCNTLKSKRSAEEFIEQIRRIYEHSKKLLKKP